MSTPEEAVGVGRVAKTIQGIRTTSYTISPDQVRQLQNISPTGYYVACVVAKPTVTNRANINYSTVENDGRSQYLVFRFKEQLPDLVDNEEEEYEEEDEPEIIQELAETEEDLLQHRTDGTDAFDTLYIGCEKFPYRDSFGISSSGVL